MHIPRTSHRYHAYLLRCWEERTGSSSDEVTWRFLVEEVGKEGRHGFISLEDVYTFLHQELTKTNLEQVVASTDPSPDDESLDAGASP